MENTILTKTFFQTTYSIQQARSRLRLLRNYLIDNFFAPSPVIPSSVIPNLIGDPDNIDSRFRGNDNGQIATSPTAPRNDKKEAGMTTSDPWLASLGENFYNEFSHANVYQKLKVLEDAITQTEPLVVYIAFDMPDDEINKLGPWMRKNILVDLLFDIKIDPTLMGGCAFSWHGIFKDYSLRAKVVQNRDRILANIKSITK